MVVIRSDGIQDWSLKHASKELGVSCEEIIRLGKEGKIALSIRLPKGFELWLITLKPEVASP